MSGQPRFDVEDLPVVKGFRQRGLEMTRIETFTDAAFAFSLTLLVISFDSLPASFDEFLMALRNVPAFAGGFATLAMFWYGHHVWSRRFGLDDGPTALLSLLFVFVMLIYVYPLRMVMSALFYWLSGGWMPFMLDAMPLEQLADIFVIYGIGFAAMSGLLALHYRYALSRSEALSLDAEERFTTVSEIYAWLILAAIGLLSVAWALLTPPLIARWAGFSYALLGLVMPLYGILRERAWRRRSGSRG
ncbi:MAG: TMEM175 family protein [Wenzhouxiangella sp.]|nr:TMEM175 family protein [Wenzhouxiangella sp.]